MKSLLPYLLFVSSAAAQWVVHDPGNTAVNAAVQAGQAANHLEVMRQWAEQLERLNRQLRQLEAQLAVQQRIRDVIGDPSAAGVGLVLRDLGANDLARTYGETLAAARRLANALDSLRRTSDGIYRQLDDRTVLGRPFARQEQLYRRFAAVERQADTFAEVQAQTDARLRRLQEEFAQTLEDLRGAGTQAEVDKLAAKLAALGAQLVQLTARRREEADKLTALHILNKNQAAKEQQDLLERQLAEEKQSLGVIARWQESIRIEPTRFRRP
jgi:phosphoglycolate phosphatase-like HAD superfamily hydrolase